MSKLLQKTETTSTLALGTLALALRQRELEPLSKIQEKICRRIGKYRKIKSVPHMAGIASGDAKELAQFAKQHKIELGTKPIAEGMVYIGLLDMAVKWQKPSRITYCMIEDKSYKYIEMAGVQRYTGAGKAAYALPTEDDFTVWLSVGETNPELINVGWNKTLTAEHEVTLVFPFVKLREELTLPLDGMLIDEMPVHDAKQINQIRLTDKGAEARSETVVRTKKAKLSEPPIMIIDRPFHLWITHQATGDLPLISAYVEKKFWRRA